MPLLEQACSRSITLCDLEKLIGKLEFMALDVRVGRSYMYYTRRTLVAHQQQKESTPSTMPDSMYYIHLTADRKAEMHWWKSALADDVTCSIDLHLPWPISAVPIEPTSDASEWGCGAYCNGQYISLPWNDEIKLITDILSGKR